MVKAKIPLHAHIPAPLGLIGENEENIIETVMLAVVNARYVLILANLVTRSDVVRSYCFSLSYNTPSTGIPST